MVAIYTTSSYYSTASDYTLFNLFTCFLPTKLENSLLFQHSTCMVITIMDHFNAVLESV